MRKGYCWAIAAACALLASSASAYWEVGDLKCATQVGAVRCAEAVSCYCSGPLFWNTCSINTRQTQWLILLMDGGTAQYQYQSVYCITDTLCDHPGIFCTESPDNCTETAYAQSQPKKTWIYVGVCPFTPPPVADP